MTPKRTQPPLIELTPLDYTVVNGKKAEPFFGSGARNAVGYLGGFAIGCGAVQAVIYLSRLWLS